MWRTMSCRLCVSAMVVVSLLHRAHGDFSYVQVANQDYLQHGDGTFYGQQQAQDGMASCSFNENRANTMNLSWTTGAAVSLAINNDQYAEGKSCGLCIMYTGVGGGIGMTPISTTQWFMGFVNNVCPECSRGSLDQNIDGDGRWKIEWYGVPCNVGDGKLQYSFVMKDYYFFEFVVSNTRIPINGVSVYINGKWLDLARTHTNTWAYYRTNGDWQGAFPMPIRITSAIGETLEDSITSENGNTGKVQFKEIPGPAYVSADVPGRGVRPRNAFTLKNGIGAIPNIGPIPGATAYGAPGWSNSSTGTVNPQRPNKAPSTSSQGDVYVSSTFQVPDGSQCGGTGGNCQERDRGQPTRPCIPGAWPLALCAKSGSTCQPQSESFWSCQPSPLAYNSGSGSSSASSGSSPSSPASVAYKVNAMSSDKSSPSGSSPQVYNLASGDSSQSWSSPGSPVSPYSSPSGASSPSPSYSPSQSPSWDSSKSSSPSWDSWSNSPGKSYSPSNPSSSWTSSSSPKSYSPLSPSPSWSSSSSSSWSPDGSKSQYSPSSASPSWSSSSSGGSPSWDGSKSQYSSSPSYKDSSPSSSGSSSPSYGSSQSKTSPSSSSPDQALASGGRKLRHLSPL